MTWELEKSYECMPVDGMYGHPTRVYRIHEKQLQESNVTQACRMYPHLLVLDIIIKCYVHVSAYHQYSQSCRIKLSRESLQSERVSSLPALFPFWVSSKWCIYHQMLGNYAYATKCIDDDISFWLDFCLVNTTLHYWVIISLWEIRV